MRNLKRALSLALASVMLVGMMVVGTSAASYPDVDSNDNVEAIAVLQAVGAMVGDSNGNFNPDNKVTRNEMAAVMARLLLGADAEKYVGICTFTDVPQWAQKYVAACADNGIIKGVDATTFDGSRTVTAQEAAAMMLRALGYEKLQGKGADWASPIVAKASRLELFKGLDGNATATLDRNDVAQVALNTLKATMVDSEVKQDIIVEGIVTIPGEVTYTDRTVTANAAYASINSTKDGGKDIVQLGEYLYKGKLTLVSGTDDMKRPANVWSYKGEAVAKAATEPDWTTVVKKNNKPAATLIADHNSSWNTTTYNHNSGTPGDAGKIITINGGAFDNSATVGNLKVGDVVEVYLNPDAANQVMTIAVTRYTAGKVTGNVATKEDGGKLKVRVPGVVSSYTETDKVIGYEGLEKDDIVYSYTDAASAIHIFKADSFEGKLTGTKTGSSGTPNGYTINGQTYYINGQKATITDVNGTPVYNTLYEYFVDANGYLIDCKKIEEAKSDYVVVDKIVFVPGDGSINASNRVEAKIVRMDGTTEVVKVNSVKVGAQKYVGINTDDNDGTNNMEDKDGSGNALADGAKHLVYDTDATANSSGSIDHQDTKLNATVSAKAKKAFFTYSEGSDGYDLEEVVAKPADKITVGTIGNKSNNEATDKEIENGGAKIGSNNIPVNKNTVFVIAKDASNTKDYVAYTGNTAVPDVIMGSGDVAYTAYVAKDGIATHVFVGQYGTASTGGDTIFILSTTPSRYEVKKDSKNKDMPVLWYKAIVDGEAAEVMVKAASTSTTNVTIDGSTNQTAIPAVKAYEPTYNSDGVITALKSDTDSKTVQYGYKMDAGTLVAGTEVYTAASNAVVYLADKDLENVTATTAGELTDEVNDAVYVVVDKDGHVDYAVVIEKDNDVVTYKKISVEDGSNNLNTDDNSGSFSKSGTTINVTRGATAANTSGGVTVEATDSKAKVEYSTTSATAGFSTTAPATLTFAAQVSGQVKTTTVYVKITAADGDTTETYTINVNTPAGA